MIATALDGYRALYPTYGETLAKEKARLYFALLDDLDETTLSRALQEAAKTCKAFPTPAHIRECAAAIGENSIELEAEAELAKLDALVSEWGVDRMPVYVGKSAVHPDGFRRCPEIGGAIGHALASVGGWRNYASRSERDSPFMRKDILLSYVRLRRAGQEPCTLIEAGRGAMAGEIAAAAIGRSM